MYRINQVRLPVGFEINKLSDYLAAVLKLKKDILLNVELYKLSIDARDKSDLHYKAGILFDVVGKFNVSKYNVYPLKSTTLFPPLPLL